jgi:hypothetical protein
VGSAEEALSRPVVRERFFVDPFWFAASFMSTAAERFFIESTVGVVTSEQLSPRVRD